MRSPLATLEADGVASSVACPLVAHWLACAGSAEMMI
jgi:hypothetical protein